MELVYLWVEDYKNIQKQGFNFSPRFRCEYDEEKNELTIDENKDYVSIFPDNINVTAIVGENGSGKSSILERLNSSFGTKLSIIFTNDNIEIYTFIKNIRIKNVTNKSYLIRDKRLSQVHFSWDILQYKPVLDWYSYCNVNPNIFSEILGTFSHPEYIDLNSYQNGTVLKYIEIYLKSKANIFSFSPNKIDIKFPMKKNDNEWNFEKIKEKIEKLKFPKETENKKKEKYFETIKKYIEIYLPDGNYEKNFTIDEYSKMLKELHEMKEILSKSSLFMLDMYDNEISFFSLSHGERSILLSNALIYDSIIENKNQEVLICLDEPDLSLHPEWQKKYINELIKMFSKIEKKFHFIITSHSPFILSDVSKENVVFLEKGKQVYPFKDGKQTFGANIHTLLSHGFFMKDGLMGEFAKEKINDVYKFLTDGESNVKTKKEAQNIINLIGEPLIKRQLEDIYNRKFQIKSKDEIIQELQNKIAELEKNQNDSN